MGELLLTGAIFIAIISVTMFGMYIIARMVIREMNI
jgi:hypothetical protein